ncbi:hypothetical protein BPTFM16_01204 [Altererythrobacter insulae]|nr:hypothetical protein BPTFM16_01204 [Altererythrobacter insulae]
MTGLDIAIAGCGPAGLAAALLLDRDGHHVTLFERFDAPKPVGSGLMIQPSGMAVLASLGLSHEVASRGARIDGLLGIQQDGKIALEAPYSKLSRRKAFGLGTHRASLFGSLYDAVRDADISVVTGATVSGSEIAGKRRRLLLEEQSCSESFDLIVDAMGWRSPLTGPQPAHLPYGALWATLPLEANDPFAGNLLEQRYRHAEQMMGVLPMGKRDPTGPREAAFFWSLKADQYDAWQDAGLDHWKDDARALWPEAECLLERIFKSEQLTFARYAHRTAKKFAEPALVRIGDSWHSASPQLGQGANMALLDAFALAAGLKDQRTVADGLRSAHRARGDHVWLYQLITSMFTPLYQSDRRTYAMIRDRMLAPLSRLGPVSAIQAQLMSGLFGYPLQPLGLEMPDYSAIASRMASIASSDAQS